MTMLSVVIPFCGFYESAIDAEFDHAVNMTMTDERGNPRDDMAMHLQDTVEWSAVNLACAQKYAAFFADHVGVCLTFEKLDSPREYNFQTDRIFCTVSALEARRILGTVDLDTLDRIAEERHTSCSGFVSFYSPDVDDWGDVETWEPEQLHTLLLAYMGDKFEGSDDPIICFCSDMCSNGAFDEMIYANAKDAERLYRINEYLNKREARTA